MSVFLCFLTVDVSSPSDSGCPDGHCVWKQTLLSLSCFLFCHSDMKSNGHTYFWETMDCFIVCVSNFCIPQVCGCPQKLEESIRSSATEVTVVDPLTWVLGSTLVLRESSKRSLQLSTPISSDVYHVLLVRTRQTLSLISLQMYNKPDMVALL